MNNKLYLMHKNFIVAECTKDAIIKIVDAERLPHQIKFNNNFVQWLNGRIIPATRIFYKRILEILEMPNYDILDFIIENRALSLTDCYWIKRIDDEKTWDDVNYYKNDFNEELISLYMDSQIDEKYLNAKLLHPSNSLDGNMPKCWIIKDKERYLVKKPAFANYQTESECIISDILDEYKINHVKYGRYDYKGKSCSICKCMCSEDIEFIPAEKLMMLLINGDLNKFYDIDLFAKEFHFEEEINKMLAIDYIVSNTDRHWNNFGVLRNVNDLSIIGLAPLFDHGNALWFSCTDDEIGKDEIYRLKPKMNISNIKDMKLEKVDFDNVNIKSELNEERNKKINDEVNKRIDILRKF